MSEETYKTLCDKLIATIESIEELGLAGKKGSITVLFPKDLMIYGLGEEIIAEVSGLFSRPERTDEVRARLATKIAETLHDFFPGSFIECFVHPFDPRLGYHQIKPG